MKNQRCGLKDLSKILFIMVIVSNFTILYGTNPPEEFFTGLDLLAKNSAKAKNNFQIAAIKDSSFHGTYHFLGVIYIAEIKYDSAVSNFKKSIYLNKTNTNHTREMAYSRLIDVYLYQHDFDNSFSTAWEAFQQYPESKTIKNKLMDVCQWSFYVKHNGLSATYMSKDLIDEYTVRSVPEEYLIIRRKLVDGNPLYVESQSVTNKNNVYYDILTCAQNNSNKKIIVKFKLDWDFNNDFGGRHANTSEVYSNSNNPVYERIGALLVSDSMIDLKSEIEKLK